MAYAPEPTDHPLHQAWVAARKARKFLGRGAMSDMCPYPALTRVFGTRNRKAGLDHPELIAKLITEIKDNSFTIPEKPYPTAFAQNVKPKVPKSELEKATEKERDRDSPNPRGKQNIGQKRGLRDKVPPEARDGVAKAFEAMKLPEYGDLQSSKAWQKLGPKNALFIYTYFASGFDLMKAFTTAWPEQRPTPTMDLKQQAQIALGRADVVRGLKVLVDYFLAERRIVLAPKILDVLEAQAFYDVGDIINEDGELVKPLQEMTREQRLCIKGIETKYYGKNADVEQKVVTLVDRQQSLDKLARFIALFTLDRGDADRPPDPNVPQQHLHVHLPTDRVGHLKGIFQAASNLRLPTLNKGLTPEPLPVDGEDDSLASYPDDSPEILAELHPDDVPHKSILSSDEE